MDEIFNRKESIEYNSKIPNGFEEFVDKEEYIAMGQRMSTAYQYLYKFYDENGLSKVRLCDNNGEVVRDPVLKTDLTQEGIEFSKYGFRWIDSKSSGKTPPDIKPLLKRLNDFRNKHK